jgi:ribonuclease HI
MYLFVERNVHRIHLFYPIIKEFVLLKSKNISFSRFPLLELLECIVQYWETRLVDFTKINFDGDSKGNIGSTGEGGVFHDETRTILFIYAFNMGSTTNNAVDLSSLLQGLQLAPKLDIRNIVIKGDLTIIIHDLTRILCGKNLDKISNNWQLLANYIQVSKLIISIHSIIPPHVRRKGNGLDDYLSNQGLKIEGQNIQLA